MALLAARQHGVVSRHQLRELGLTNGSIARAVTTGRLHPVFRGAYAVGHPEIGWRGSLQAAVFTCAGSVVSHATAAALFGMVDRPPALIDVISPSQAGRKVDGIRSHRVPFPLGDEITERDGIPCTSPARTLVDQAGALGDASLRRLVEQAAVLGILDIPSIEAIMERGRRRGSPRLRTVLSAWAAVKWRDSPPEQARLRSALEARVLALIGAHRLPTPVCNHIVEVAGERYEADLLWPQQRLIVEADGGKYHDNPGAFERDRLRDRALHTGGYRVVRVTWAQVEAESDAIAAAIRSLLTAVRGQNAR